MEGGQASVRVEPWFGEPFAPGNGLVPVTVQLSLCQGLPALDRELRQLLVGAQLPAKGRGRLVGQEGTQLVEKWVPTQEVLLPGRLQPELDLHSVGVEFQQPAALVSEGPDLLLGVALGFVACLPGFHDVLGALGCHESEPTGGWPAPVKQGNEVGPEQFDIDRIRPEILRLVLDRARGGHHAPVDLLGLAELGVQVTDGPLMRSYRVVVGLQRLHDPQRAHIVVQGDLRRPLTGLLEHSFAPVVLQVAHQPHFTTTRLDFVVQTEPGVVVGQVEQLDQVVELEFDLSLGEIAPTLRTVAHPAVLANR